MAAEAVVEQQHQLRVREVGAQDARVKRLLLLSYPALVDKPQDLVIQAGQAGDEVAEPDGQLPALLVLPGVEAAVPLVDVGPPVLWRQLPPGRAPPPLAREPAHEAVGDPLDRLPAYHGAAGRLQAGLVDGGLQRSQQVEEAALDGPDLLRRGHLLQFAAVLLQLLPLEERRGGGADEPGDQRAERPERVADTDARRRCGAEAPGDPPDDHRDDPADDHDRAARQRHPHGREDGRARTAVRVKHSHLQSVEDVPPATSSPRVQ